MTVIKEVIKEVPVEVIKEVPVEVIRYVAVEMPRRDRAQACRPLLWLARRRLATTR